MRIAALFFSLAAGGAALAQQAPSNPVTTEQAREQAYELLLQHARELRANAIVGLRYESSEVGRAGSATEVLCYGTAVVIQRA